MKKIVVGIRVEEKSMVKVGALELSYSDVQTAHSAIFSSEQIIMAQNT